jgi:hypothetical protein
MQSDLLEEQIKSKETSNVHNLILNKKKIGIF